MKGTWDTVRQDVQAAATRVQTITADQKRLRENMRELPEESKLFKRYLKTLENQETEMDDFQAKLKEMHAYEAKAEGGIRRLPSQPVRRVANASPAGGMTRLPPGLPGDG